MRKTNQPQVQALMQMLGWVCRPGVTPQHLACLFPRLERMPQIEPLLPWKTQAADLHACKSVSQLRSSYLEEEEVRGAEPGRRLRSGGEHSVRHLNSFL
ncbi:hypothetical protein IMZ48_14925 [Candidatus Bathyarchaeota archaeon]|nr:hypothetical protein [Candidatus Bathyarchaeota archaeon]